MTAPQPDPGRDGARPAFVAAIVATGSIAITAAVPASPHIADAMAFDDKAATWVAGFFVLGYAVGHVAAGALGDRLARRPYLIASLLVFTAASLAGAAAGNAETVLAARFIQGTGASACPVIGRAMVRRARSFEASARKMSSATALFTWAPVAAPLAAGVLAAQAGWRAMFIALAAYGLGVVWMATRSAPAVFAHAAPSGSIGREALAVLRTPSVRRGLAVAAVMFTGFFASLALAPALTGSASGPPLAVATSLVAGAYAGGGAMSRWMLATQTSERVLRRATLSAAAVAAGLSVAAVAGVAASLVFALSVVFALCAGAALPNATALAMRDAPHNAVLAMALLGVAKMALASMVTFFIATLAGPPAALLGAVFALCAFAALLAAGPRGLRPAR